MLTNAYKIHHTDRDNMLDSTEADAERGGGGNTCSPLDKKVETSIKQGSLVPGVAMQQGQTQPGTVEETLDVIVRENSQ